MHTYEHSMQNKKPQKPVHLKKTREKYIKIVIAICFHCWNCGVMFQFCVFSSYSIRITLLLQEGKFFGGAQEQNATFGL